MCFTSLSLFIFILHTIFCFIPIPLFIKQLCIFLLNCIYFLFTWPATPFIRSFALFLLNQLCFASKFSFHLLHYLILTCFCFLLYNPLHLFFLDFQLTFALTFALAWFNQVLLLHNEKWRTHCWIFFALISLWLLYKLFAHTLLRH